MEEAAGMDLGRGRTPRLRPQVHATRRSPRLQPKIQATEDGAGVTRGPSPRIQQGAGVTSRRSPRFHPKNHASEEGTRPRRRTSADPLPDDDDMLREILLRLPTHPSSLPRAAAVCRRWRGLAADPRFLRQLCAHHRRPPLLGVFSRGKHAWGVAFSPILGPPDRVPPRRFNLGRCSSRYCYDLIDCRHGLVLLKNTSRTEFVVCDPVVGDQRRVAVPPELKKRFFNGAVLCAAADLGHSHGGCHSSPFKVVLISLYRKYNQPFARVYSSETDEWGDLILTQAPCEISREPAVLVGNCLYWLPASDDILVFDLGQHSLTVIRGPPVTEDDILFQNRQIIQAEDGAVGYAMLSCTRFQMWQRNINGHGVATWVLWKTIGMDTILRPPSPHEEMYVQLLGYDEDDVVFLCYDGSVYMLQLKSMQSRKLAEIHTTGYRLFPFKSFFTPGVAIASGINGAEMLHIG